MTKEELRSLIENFLIEKGIIKRKWDCRNGFLENFQDGFCFETHDNSSDNKFMIVINN